MTTHVRFPSPYDIKAPQGAEGWKRLYPYYLVFQDKLKEQEDAKFWFCDSQHWPTVFKPFETIGGRIRGQVPGPVQRPAPDDPQRQRHRVPRSTWATSTCRPSRSPPDQIAAPRAAVLNSASATTSRTGTSLLEQWHVKVKGTIDETGSRLLRPSCPDVVPMEDILSGKGKDGSEKLLESYDRLIQLAYQNWQYHFEFLNLGYVAYLDFFSFCKQVFPDIPDQAIATMVQGVDMELFRPDDELKQLAKLAVELGLQPHFGDTARRRGHPGRHRRRPRAGTAGWRSTRPPRTRGSTSPSGNGFYGHDKYWNEHQEIPLGYIADYIRRVDEGQEIIAPGARHSSPNATASSRNTASCSTAKARAASTPSAGSPRTVYPYVENHNFYIEHWTMGVFWRKIRELSRMMQAEGFWTEPDDLLYLGRNEVRDALFDLRHRLGRRRQADRSGLLAGRDRAPPRRSWTRSRPPGPPRR